MQYVSSMKDNNKIRIFISHSHLDHELCVEFEKHLKVLKQSTPIDFFLDLKHLHAGDVLDMVIRNNIDNSDIVLFLLSTDLLVSDYVMEKELPYALSQNKNITYVVLRICHWEDTIFSNYVGLIPNNIPITNNTNNTREYIEHGFYFIKIGRAHV